MLQLTRALWLEMVAHAYDGLPDEACGLLVGDLATGSVAAFHPCRNAARSSRIYEIDGRDYLRVDRAAEAEGLDIVGVMHSHTHTEAYPSPTDVRQAVDPDWHYVIVSLKRPEPALRSFRIADGTSQEEAVSLTPR
ncbi:MAG TPA: M67 family metallopeptidase [Acidimicrobiales bacterium]